MGETKAKISLTKKKIFFSAETEIQISEAISNANGSTIYVYSNDDNKLINSFSTFFGYSQTLYLKFLCPLEAQGAGGGK